MCVPGRTDWSSARRHRLFTKVSTVCHPDSSAPGTDGPGYSPDEATNRARAGRSNSVRDVLGLYEDMNRSFWTTGLGVPWYGIFGNHDGLIQGNQPRNPALEAYATGCVKVQGLSPIGQAELTRTLGSGLDASSLARPERRAPGPQPVRLVRDAGPARPRAGRRLPAAAAAAAEDHEQPRHEQQRSIGA